MGNGYVQILCGVCGGKIIALGGQARPTTCTLCGAELRPATGSARPTDNNPRAPQTFTRGTFTSASPKPPTVPGRPSGNARKPASALQPGGSLKDKLIRLFRS